MNMIPCRINGVDGCLVDDSLMDRKDIRTENENEIVDAVEYWLEGELVHRSAHVQLKQGIGSLLEQGAFN
jgi:hypothetical protein